MPKSLIITLLHLPLYILFFSMYILTYGKSLVTLTNQAFPETENLLLLYIRINTINTTNNTMNTIYITNLI